MRRSERTARLDYKEFNSTGKKIYRSDLKMSEALKIDIEVLQSDILDFIDENESYTDASSVDDVIAKLIDLRTSFK